MIRALVLVVILLAPRAALATTDFAVFGFHDVVDEPRELGADAVVVRHLAAFFGWLRQHDYRVISVDDVLAANRGERLLPPRAVLLSFDDGYRSFYTRVFPLLRAFRYPATLAIVGGWIEPPLDPTSNLGITGTPLAVPPGRFLTWDELRVIQLSGLVEIASHTFGLYGTIEANPAGGELPAAIARTQGPGGRAGPRLVKLPSIVRQPAFGDLDALLVAPYARYLALAGRLVGVAMDYRYDPRDNRYETDEEYTARIRVDLARNSRLIEGHLGIRPRVVVWPYGRYNQVAAEAARAEGMPIGMSLDPERADARDLQIPRFYPGEDPNLATLTSMLEARQEPPLLRGLCVSLDDVNADSAEESERRLGRVIERVAALKPGMVRLGALSAPDASGRNVAYFPNREVPVRHDLFGRAAWQIRTRAGVEVYADLPLRPDGLAETAPATYEALAKLVPFDGLSLGPEVLLGLPPGAPPASGWDPRTPRRVRAAVDRGRVDEKTRVALRAVDTVTRYQPALKLMDIVGLENLKTPSEVGLDAVDYLAVRWDGPPETAIRQLRRQGWLKAPAVRTLVYASARGDAATWRVVERAGLVHRLYCPPRLPADDAALMALRPFLSASDFPYVKR